MSFAKPDKNVSMSVYMMLALSLMLAGFIFYLVASNQKFFESKYSLYMFEENAQGLIPGAFVTLSGLKVGIVGDMDFTEKDGVQGIRVELKIDEKYADRITGSSSAKVQTMGMLGDKFVEITLGELTEAPLLAETYIDSRSGPDMEGMLADAKATVTELKGVLANTRVLTASAQKGNGIIGKLMIDDVAAKNFTALVNNLRDASQKAISGKGTLSQLINDEAIYANIKKSSDKMQAVMDSLHTGNGTFAQLIKDKNFYTRLRNISVKTDSLLYNMQNGGTTGKLLKDAKFYNNLVSLSGSLDSLSTDMQKNPNRYVNLSLF